VLRTLLAEAALVSAVVAVKLLFFLAARHHDAGGVDHDDVIPGVDMGGVNRLVLPLQQASSFGRHTAQNLTVGINHVPLPDDGSGGGDKRTHEIPFGLSSCRPGCNGRPSGRPPAEAWRWQSASFKGRQTKRIQSIWDLVKATAYKRRGPFRSLEE